jgi:hypothetical protein
VYNIISNINTILEVLIMQAHLIKYKDKDGNWVSIPVAMQDMYQAYVDYCEANNITAVSQNTYYATIGNLQELVETLGDNTGNIEQLIAALSNGALPITMGGTGLNISATAFSTLVDYLATPTSEGGAGLISRTAVESLIEEKTTNLTQLVSNAFDGAIIAYGTDTPDKLELGTDVKYFFQCE